MSSLKKAGANIGRGLFFAISGGTSEKYIFKRHRFTHDVIEAHIRFQCRGCEKNECIAKNGNICDSNPYYTLEFTEGGSYMNIGYFTKTLHVDKEYEPTYMNLKHLKEIYNDRS